jgi:hypothetical protein
MKPWYENPLLIAFVAFVLGIVASSVGAWWQQHLTAGSRAESLKVAFRGEVNAIRDGLSVDARAAFSAWQKKTPIKDHQVGYPTKIFDSHAGSIGDLRESILVGHLSLLYSTIDRAREVGRRIDASTYSGDGPRDFATLLAIALNQALILDMRLTEQTKHLKEESWSVTVSEQDAADRNFVGEVLQTFGLVRLLPPKSK